VGQRRFEEREVVIEGPFEPDPHRDAVFARATVTIRQPAFEPQTFRVIVVSSCIDRDIFLSRLSPTDYGEALGWFALVQLANTPSDQLTAPTSGGLPEVQVAIPSGTGERSQWEDIRRVREYKDDKLRDYETGYEQGRWFARPRRTST